MFATGKPGRRSAQKRARRPARIHELNWASGRKSRLVADHHGVFHAFLLPFRGSEKIAYRSAHLLVCLSCSLFYKKMMKVKQIIFLFLSAAWLLASCGDQQECCDLPPQEYIRGVFVVNEGPWGGTGTISWYNPDSGETLDSLYEKANNGAVLGQFVQSLTFHNDKGYIVVNGADRVVVVDARNFRYLDTIGGLHLPRYFLPIDNNTAYISQWGADGVTGSIAKVDLNTNKVLKTIPTGKGPEKMLRVNDKVYVANSGGYGVDSTLTEISVPNDVSQILSITKGINPATLAWDGRQTPGNLFYLCKGYFLDPSPEGWLDYRSNTGLGMPVPSFADDLCINPQTGELYFIAGNTVYKAVRVGADLGVSPLFQRASYGLGFDAEQGLLYCADAKDFVSNGEVFVHRTDGSLVGSFRAGVAPSEIVLVK